MSLRALHVYLQSLLCVTWLVVVEEVEEAPVEEPLLLELGEVALVVVADAEVARDHAAADRALVQFRQTVGTETRVSTGQQCPRQWVRGAHAAQRVGRAVRRAVALRRTAALAAHVQLLQTRQMSVRLLQVLRDHTARQRALVVSDVHYAY